jgi:hypothetical protein
MSGQESDGIKFHSAGADRQAISASGWALKVKALRKNITPSGDDICHDAGVVVEYVQEDQVVQINSLHQDPIVVGEERVLPYHGEHFTGKHLSQTKVKHDTESEPRVIRAPFCLEQ